MTEQMILWRSQTPKKIPNNVSSPERILPFADPRQLSSRDRAQVITAFNGEHYEMVSSFVWTKALTSLKAQLGKLGTAFISEMLDRPDIDGSLSVDQVLTDFEALRLAKELGVISSTGALRLRQSLERLMHFGQLPSDDDEDVEMTSDEAVGVLRACVENILGQERIDAALDFKVFRDALEEQLLTSESESVQLLRASPYFFHRASIRMLLSLVKSKQGASLEKALANANVIVPLLWKGLLGPEKFQVGRAYTEVTSDGKAKAASGLRKVLLKVQGFDYVPEDLRSRSFVKAANALIAAHEGMNNFYNEPGPAKYLSDMGTTLPIPAFPICMTAVLSVRLGNNWGICFDAQKYANLILKRVSSDRWLYFLNDCLKTDDRLLSKLLDDGPRKRWMDVVREFGLDDLSIDVSDASIRHLLTTDESKKTRATSAARKMIERLGS